MAHPSDGMPPARNRSFIRLGHKAISYACAHGRVRKCRHSNNPDASIEKDMTELNTTEKKYDPNHLIDAVTAKLELKNDAAVARALKVETPIIEKLRNNRLPLGGYLLMRLREVTGLSVIDLQELMGDRRRKFRMNVRPNRTSIN